MTLHTWHEYNPEYLIGRLKPEHTEALQRLLEQCADYAMLVEGEAVSPSAAQDLFNEAPPGRSLSDKFLYGVWDRKGNIVGVLEGMRHYPDETTWWIGLLLLAPQARGCGLGRKLVEGFTETVRSEQGGAVMLGVVEDNQAAYRFWLKLGFEPVRQTEPRPFGKKVQTVHVMRRNLTSG
jgi:ribosomal protein S18 acetylase RimI-like enzyme